MISEASFSSASAVFETCFNESAGELQVPPHAPTAPISFEVGAFSFPKVILNIVKRIWTGAVKNDSAIKNQDFL